MLDRLDETDWAALSHAYGAADDVPALLRQAASDGDAAGEAISELYGNIFHQGTVYSATVAAVPFLAELARSAPGPRAEFVWLLGMLADPHHAYGAAFDDVRAAVAGEVGVLAPLLDDPDSQVRAAAAYAVVQCGATAALLWERWAVEEEPLVRASLLLALGELDPDGAAKIVTDAVVQAEPSVRFAAALALVRHREPWPDGAVPAVVRAIDEGVQVEYAWQRHGDCVDELLVNTDDETAEALLTELLAAPSPDSRQAGIWALTVRAQARRSAPARLLPLVRPLLDEPDEEVRAEAMAAFRRCGAAAGGFADDVARVAAGFPETAGSVAITPERKAVETLMLLGDPRWVDPVCAAAERGHDLATLAAPHGGMPCRPAVLEAVRRRLREFGDLGRQHPAIGVLAAVLGDWGPSAAPAVPELMAVLPYATEVVSRALLRIGHATEETVPHLRTVAGRTGDVAAAVAVWRVTGDAQPLLDAVRPVLAGRTAWLPAGAHAAAEAGVALLPLLPAARARLTGTAAPTWPQRDIQVLAARLVWAAAGDPGPALPTVLAVLTGGHTPAGRAAELVAELAATHATDLADFRPVLRDQLTGRWSGVQSARALWRLGTPATELVAPLVAAISADQDWRSALSLLVEMNAVEAVADLERLAERDERIVTSGVDDDIAWHDEALRAELRSAVGKLRAGT